MNDCLSMSLSFCTSIYPILWVICQIFSIKVFPFFNLIIFSVKSTNCITVNLIQPNSEWNIVSDDLLIFLKVEKKFHVSRLWSFTVLSEKVFSQSSFLEKFFQISQVLRIFWKDIFIEHLWKADSELQKLDFLIVWQSSLEP